MTQSIIPNDSLAAAVTEAPLDSLNVEVKRDLADLSTGSFDDLFSRLSANLAEFAIHLAVAILVFYLGRFVIIKIYNLVGSIMMRRRVDRSLTTFVLSLIKMVLYFILIVTVIGIIGIETSSFIALFASAGVALGMALSGTLQNFAGGVLILLLKPYKIGDYIEAEGYAGTVTEIQIFHTIICTPDNKSIIIPNGGLSTGSINNWSREEYRRVDWSVGISYGDSVEAARRAILAIVESDERVVRHFIEEDRQMRQNPDGGDTVVDTAQQKRRSRWRRWLSTKAELPQAQEDGHIRSLRPKIDCSPRVLLKELADSSVNLTVRAWTRSADYWEVYFSILERIYSELPDAAGVSFPFPQMDVHVTHPDAP